MPTTFLTRAAAHFAARISARLAARLNKAPRAEKPLPTDVRPGDGRAFGTDARTHTEPQAGADAQAQWLVHLAGLSRPQALAELNTREHGLAEAEVAAARELWGSNRLAQSERPALLARVAAAFADPFCAILVAIAAVSVLTDWVFAAPGARDLATPAIIGAMVLVSGALRFVQNERSGNASAALAQMIQPLCCVERAGAGRVELPVEELVVGDVVHLSSGDVVPADLRIVQARDLFVAQAALTGESEPVEKGARPADGIADGAALADLPTLALMGTTVISGVGTGVVAATAERTVLGRATRGLAAHGRAATASDQGMASTSRLLVGLMLVMAPTVFVICGLTKGSWLDALLFSLSVAVGLTPEMLPMLVSCCLAKGAQDLAAEKVIAKRLDAISDLGSVDVLCCDKTGTLTEDRVVLERHLDVMGNEDERVLQTAFLNSFFGTGVKNLIDSAIIRRAAEAGGAADELAARYELVDELPFDFERRRLSVVVGNAAGTTRLICKGALEEVLTCCSFAQVNGRVVPLGAELADTARHHAELLAGQGMRVLGVAEKTDPAGAGTLRKEDERDLVLVGYLAFLDPPKASAAAAVEALARHGVAVKVLTGDAAPVAAHVCGRLGIDAREVLLGTQVDGLTDAELARRAESCSVFTKLSPAQKARVVGALRAGGHTVGFMGDGVNDAAAMRASDCGISVDSAVDVAREAADIILLKKDLMVLEQGIVAGRKTLANTLKYVRITVSSNFGNIFSMLVAACTLPFLPMAPVQVLMLNLIYDLSCCALPWDRVDEREVQVPRRWDAGGLRRFMVRTGPVSSVFDALTFAALFFWVCPLAAGGAWGALDAVGQAVFAATFQAGWFVASMWTQTLAVHVLRRQTDGAHGGRRLGQRPPCAAWPVTALGAAGVAAATALPFSPVAAALDLAPLPPANFALLAAVVIGYAGALLAVSRRA